MNNLFFNTALYCCLSFFSQLVFAQPAITVEQPGSRAGKFTRLFDRTDGWLGADGIYSIPLNGNDRWGSANKNTKTLFVFSDSMLGSANAATQKYKDVKMSNHSAAILTDYDTPQKTEPNGSIQFIYGKQGNGSRTNIFDQKYWLQDGVVIDKKLHLTGFIAGKNWKPTQIDLLTIPLSDSNLPQWEKTTITERVPLLLKNEQYLVMFGIGILDHSAYDGFIYIYGYRDTLRGGIKHLVAARVTPKNYADTHQWQFWDGNTWCQDSSVAFQDKSTLAERISTELSVTAFGQNRFILVFVQNVMSGKVAYQVGSSPIGPFGQTTVFYEAPEPKTLEKGIYVYNAKAHPHLSSPDSLLISYNVNRLGSLPRNTNEYRPRFIELPMSSVKDSLAPNRP